MGVELGARVRTRYEVECWRPCFGCDACAGGRFRLCTRKWLAWRDWFENLVVTAGLNHLLVRTIKGQNAPGVTGYAEGRRLARQWVPSQAYAVGDVVRPRGSSGQLDNNRIAICEVAGTSHASTEPTWPNSDGGTVTDNTVTWLEAALFYAGLVDGASAPTYAAADTMASHAGWSEIQPYSNARRPGFTPGAVAAGSCDNSAAKAVFNVNATATVAGCFLADMSLKSPSNIGTLYGEGSFTGGNRAVQNGDTLNVQVTTSIT